MKRIIVIGANGFIGSYLCDYLLKVGFEVIAVSRKFFQNTKIENRKCRFIEIDILSEKLINLEITADAIIDLAAPNDIFTKTKPKEAMNLAVFGTKNIMEFALKNNIKNVIFFSTLQVYGSELKGTIDENSKLIPENEYALNHIFSEEYIKMYSRNYELNSVVLRPSNIYGRFTHLGIDRWSLVPACFCKEAFYENRITLLSSGNQKRNFISLECVSEYCEAILNNFPQGFNILNIASSEYLKIIEVAEIVKKIYESLYDKEVIIRKKSELPVETNNFFIKSANLDKYKTNNKPNYNLNTEIKEIFKKLEVAKNGAE
ncbi:NAD(P)-dependent oxidoreductase [Clostridium autoethanogenum]|uniref:NAD(P)-dependent oxidoreductase n=1 Tax=Clostridium autoethanogenum TaxID=84023 RepID=A0A3M0T128_9CLOT|nr:NAD(P)-dependent oxidoreductase [Clostridium autoethanogenum]RMD04339.1 NAD(P)-dependent oxidoreductase [Clostridium autoethanogenum]